MDSLSWFRWSPSRMTLQCCMEWGHRWGAWTNKDPYQLTPRYWFQLSHSKELSPMIPFVFTLSHIDSQTQRYGERTSQQPMIMKVPNNVPMVIYPRVVRDRNRALGNSIATCCFYSCLHRPILESIIGFADRPHDCPSSFWRHSVIVCLLSKQQDRSQKRFLCLLWSIASKARV